MRTDIDFPLRESVLAAVEAHGDEIKEKDQAAVNLALTYAQAIDEGKELGGYELTKALYLGPHLLKTLTALGLTPGQAKAAVEDEKPKKNARKINLMSEEEDQLAALRSRRGGA